jgi:hypothetical protein
VASAQALQLGGNAFGSQSCVAKAYEQRGHRRRQDRSEIGFNVGRVRCRFENDLVASRSASFEQQIAAGVCPSAPDTATEICVVGAKLDLHCGRVRRELMGERGPQV